jgi:hypothetical protein
MMAHHQLGETLSGTDVRRIRTWLGALAGDPPIGVVDPPELPDDAPGHRE